MAAAACAQTVFAAEAGHLTEPKGTGVLLCGQKDMCTAVTELLKQQGVEQVGGLRPLCPHGFPCCARVAGCALEVPAVFKQSLKRTSSLVSLRLQIMLNF